MKRAMKLLTPLSRPVLLSTLWIALMFNYIYCDVLGLNDPAHLVALESSIPDRAVAGV